MPEFSNLTVFVSGRDRSMRMNEVEQDELGSMEELKRRILDVTKGPKDNFNSRSWVDVVMKMKKSPKEWDDALQSLPWINQVIFKLKMDKYEKLKRQWDGLPSTALLNIFCNTELQDRFTSIPLVCKSWKYVTDDPRCWSSMIPDSVSPEDAFIKKKSGFSFPRYIPSFYNTRRRLEEEEEEFVVGVSSLFKEEGDEEFQEEEEEEVGVGLSSLRTLLKKSGGGAAITTLYLQPFLQWCPYRAYKEDDEIFHLIANRCPNLKHISILDVDLSFMEAVLRLLNKCKKLQLIEFSFDSSGVMFYGQEPAASLKLLESLSCLPDLHGINFSGCEHDGLLFTSVSVIATHLPRLKLLRLHYEPLNDEDLSIILSSCLELHYLDVLLDREPYYNQDIIDQASAQIPEFYYKQYEIDNYSVFDDDYLHNCFEDHGSKETVHASRMDDNFRINEDFRINDYRDILKQRKEDQYVSILKEKMRYKKQTNYQCNNSSLIKKKKTNSTLKKNKKEDLQAAGC